MIGHALMSAFDPKRKWVGAICCGAQTLSKNVPCTARCVKKSRPLRSAGYRIDHRYPSFRLEWNLPYTEGMISPSSSSARAAKASIF